MLHEKDTLQSAEKKIVLKGMTLAELKNWFREEGEASFRGDQLFNWMYNHRLLSFEGMVNIPKSLRQKLENRAELRSLFIHESIVSPETGTKKFLFRTHEGNIIESVIIPEEKRVTLCVSTQVGCPLDCQFCATGLMGYKKNLTAGEIFDQFLLAQSEFDRPITNIVYMGMGEPLLNFKHTLRSLEIFGSELTTGISMKKITVSTAGIPGKIRELADTGLKVKLAFSLHSVFEDIRSKIMPINDKYSLKENMEALRYFAEATDSRITYEYVMLKDINDREEDIQGLARLVKKIPSKVNIIPFNSLAHMNPSGFAAELVPSSQKRIAEFADSLRDKNITVIVRNTQGSDIAAACGQLAVKVK